MNTKLVYQLFFILLTIKLNETDNNIFAKQSAQEHLVLVTPVTWLELTACSTVTPNGLPLNYVK